MKNYVQEGQALDLIAPTGGVVSGVAYKLGAIIAVAAITAGVGVGFVGYTEGVYDLAAEGAASAQDLAVGDLVYYDATNKRVTKTLTANTLCGVAVAVKATLATVARVKLVPTI